MKVYSKVDTFASWQFGTIPYLPFPYQWHARYEALEKYGVSGTLESWSSGYKPNFIAELRAWYLLERGTSAGGSAGRHCRAVISGPAPKSWS